MDSGKNTESWEELQQALFADAAEGIFIADPQGRFTVVNPRCTELTGHTREEFLGMQISDIISAEDRAWSPLDTNELFQDKAVTTELRIKRKDGSLRAVDCSVHKLSDGNILGMLYDVTERKQIEVVSLQRARELAALQRFGLAVNASLSLAQTVSAALRGLLEVGHSDKAFLFLRDGDRLILQDMQSAEAGQPLRVIPEHRVGECICGLAVREAKPFFSRNIHQDPRCTWLECKEAGMHSLAAIPLWMKGEIIGVIGLASFTERDFASESSFFETLAHQISVALANSRLYEASQREIAERKQAEDQLKKSNDRFLNLADNVAGHIAYVNAETLRYEFVNGMFEKSFGMPRDTIIGSYVKDIIGDANYQYALPFINQVRAGKSASYEQVFNLVSGKRWIQVSYTPIFNAQGRTESIAVLSYDITERKRVEEALRENENFLGSIYRAAPTGIGVVSNRMLMSVNDKVCEMSGYSREELVGKSSRIFYSSDADYEYVGAEKYRQIKERGTGTVETRWQRKDGRIIDVLMSSTPINPKDLAAGVTFTALDITERNQAAASLRRIEWMLTRGRRSKIDFERSGNESVLSYGDLTQLNTRRVILNAVGTQILSDIVGDYLDLLDTSAAVYEKNGDYALGIFSSSWCRYMDFASRQLCNTDDNQKALDSGKWHCHESCWTTVSKASIESGTPIDIECAGGLHLYAVPIRAGSEIIGSVNVGYGDPPSDPAMLRELANKYGVSIEALAERASAYESRPAFIIELAKRRLEVSARLIGEIVERKRAEEEKDKLQEQLLQSQKMESVGRLAGGVAHDFNNMLAVIIGHVALAMMKANPSEPMHAHLTEIQHAAQRSADLTRQLLAFARKQAVMPKVLNLNDTVSGMFKMLKRLIGEDITIIWKPGAVLWPVKLDPTQIDQLLANLCINARDAISGMGKITLETQNSTIDEAYCAGHKDFVCGDYVVLVVSDTGIGMNKDVLEHLFEPFFTTKEVGKGTGLGLATVYGIVKQNNGFVHVYSEPNLGTSFKMYFPRFAGKVEDQTIEPRTEALRGKGETLLLVEDELTVLNVGRSMLEGLGYGVLAAHQPGEALELARAHADTIQLLITDVVMPEMNGRELAKLIVKIKPGLKCLFTSGYTADVIAHQGVLNDGTYFLQKPFSMNNLAKKVREALDGEVGA
jgi:PAS domain S-box-containing protein